MHLDDAPTAFGASSKEEHVDDPMNDQPHGLADEQRSVAAIYESGAVASSYLDKRMRFSWQRLLHHRQVCILGGALQTFAPNRVLEVAPGPARLSVELKGVNRGTMVENSEEMLAIARHRLLQAGLAQRWEVVHGNAFELTRHVPANAFDLAYTFRFLRHFRDGERAQLYQMLRESLKPAGILIFDAVGAVEHRRVEARNPTRAPGEIAIYDVTYTADTLSQEMRKNGFEVISLQPVLRHFGLQSLLSYKFDDVIGSLVPPILRLIERLPSRAPLEWVAVCRKVG
jgi:ubiquinone/menaquinone biosynthesis C-methylase UbiE